jgi:acetyl esterase/lipase
MNRSLPLEKAAEQICDRSAKPPFVFQLPPAQGRRMLDRAQKAPAYKHPATVSTLEVDTDRHGVVNLYHIEPEGLKDSPPVIFYIHGGGWVCGSFHTHEKLVRELAARTKSVVLFPDYSLSPEARYPTAIEQCYFILSNLEEIAGYLRWNLSFDTLTVAGDGAGGNMAAAMAILAKQRQGPRIHKQLLYYPVTNAPGNADAYRQFANETHLTRAGMQWFWNQYAPEERSRREITASPLRATREQLRGLPDTMILTAEADILREEGEAYARHLREAGVDVTALRVGGTIHDFVRLHALDNTAACRAAMDGSVAWVKRKNRSVSG